MRSSDHGAHKNPLVDMHMVGGTSRLARPTTVVVYVRHRDSCRYFEQGESYPKCDCPKWLRYSVGGRQHRVAAHTRTWGLAEERARDLQRELETGKSGQPTPEAKPKTVTEAVATFIRNKEVENISAATIRKLKFQLGYFEQFMSARSKFFPSQITPDDVGDYRASWTWSSSLTKQKAQQNLRGFLRFCCRENLPDLLGALKTIKLSRTDKARLEPQPFSEKELQQLIERVPKTFPNPETAARMTALIRCMVSTGLAIRDTIQLERENIRDGWLRIERQKTGRAVRQKLDVGLHRELLMVANGNPKYIFWNGNSKATSAVGLWQRDLRELMQDAHVWIPGNLSHRFRDTAVDFWLGAGCSLTDIAAMLGDTVAVVERHYANLASKRMEERLAKMPTRSWEPR